MPFKLGMWVAESSEYRTDRYYRHADLGALLHRWATEHPDLLEIEVIGKSYEQRDLWAITITDPATGPHDSKPAYFVDANIHAGEVTGVATVLWLINHILTNAGSDESVQRLLQETTLYVIPAINVDAMDHMLNGTASRVRSSMRPYPDATQQDGLVREDIDGDGLVATMRVQDPDGPWKVSDRDPRVMVPRGPDEFGGTYYFLLPEGTIQNWDGGAVRLAPDLRGLDVNRNFPAAWSPQWEQPGAGEFPLSEPETRALADFLVAHPNIHGTQHFHTQSGAILRPSTHMSDDDLPKFDLNTFKAIGKMGEEATGYPCISIFHDFAYDKKKPTRGTVLDWVYEHLGAYAFATELWSLPKLAGVEVKDFIEFFRDRPEDVDLAMLKVLDEQLGGHGFKEWTPFDHPQLGKVEIGGWDYQFAWQNPPGPFLEEVTSSNARFVLRAMQTAPVIEIASPEVERLADSVWRVSVIVRNSGFLPTWTSEAARRNGIVKPVKATLKVADGGSIATGLPELDLGHLDGRANQFESASFYTAYPIQSRAKAEWVVRQDRGEVTIDVTSTRAGSTSLTLNLDEENAGGA
ncbi:MAG TPA: M14 family metallopeptidase [Thermomicrobiales bacterium]|nr:M14 family metallopeptidase [Thermomicrobiales bacterium]